MPLNLVPPDRAKGETSIYIRGTYLGVRVRQSARTDRSALAERERRRIEREIEAGRFADAAPVASRSFADAALGYLEVCGQAEVPLVERLLTELRDTPLADFTKDLIDATERKLYPPRPPKDAAKDKTPRPYAAGTMNRMYRAPLAAVLHHAAKRGLMGWLRVEKHAEQQRTAWLEPEQAADLIAAARDVDAGKTKNNNARLAPLLAFLFTTGARLSEAINLTWKDVDLARRHVILRDTKNGGTYGVHLGELVFEEIANLPHFQADGSRHPDRKIFGYSHRRSIRWALAAAAKKAKVPKFNAHMARHSFATWLRRNGEDFRKIMELGRWKDAKSMIRYQHVASAEQVDAIARLPLKRVKKESA